MTIHTPVDLDAHIPWPKPAMGWDAFGARLLVSMILREDDPETIKRVAEEYSLEIPTPERTIVWAMKKVQQHG